MKACKSPLLYCCLLSVVCNYRPVSLLCVSSKLFEKLMHKLTMFYFRQKLTAVQHGFMKGRSVEETNLCSFLNFSVPVVVSKGQVDAIYFDRSKAFDKVDHGLLLNKLSLIWLLFGIMYLV